MPDSVALLQNMPRVLIADDQPAVIEALRLLLKGEGFETRAVASPADAAEALARQSFDVALIDLNYTRDTTSGQEGLDLLARLRELDPTLPVVVMTAWGSVEVAVEAMQRAAAHDPAHAHGAGARAPQGRAARSREQDAARGRRQRRAPAAHRRVRGD